MAGEIVAPGGTTGAVAYYLLRNAAGLIWNTVGAAFEAYNALNYADYDIALTEQGASGTFVGDMPAGVTARGNYGVEARLRAGGSPAETDRWTDGGTASGNIRWTGSAEEGVQDIDSDGAGEANVTKYGGTAGTFSSGRPEVNTTHAAGTAWGSGAITAASIANGAIDAATFAADVDAEILSYLVDDATRIKASALNTATVTTIPAILDDTDDIGVAGAGLTAIPWNANWDAEVESEVDDALIAKGLDHLVFTSVTGTDVADNSIIALLATGSGDWDAFAKETDSLEAIGFGMQSLITDVAAILADTNELQADDYPARFTAIEGATFDTSTDSLEAIRNRGDAAWLTATGFSTHSAADVWAVGARTLTAFGFTVDINSNADITAILEDTGTTLPATLATIAGYLDTEIAAIKAVTDQFVFTVANRVDATASGAGSGLDTYQGRCTLFDDNADATDRYAVVFYKNGEPITTGITSPTIQVIKVADGTDLIAQTAMTEVGSEGFYRHDETTNRIVSGEAYMAKVTATIGAATRTWISPVGRDST